MRYATATNLGTSSYSELLDSCQHSRLKAALQSHLSPRHQSFTTAHAAQSYDAVSSATKAYLCVVCMSMLSLVSVVVSGAVTV